MNCSKRAFDLSCAVLALLFLWPFFVLASLLIKLDELPQLFNVIAGEMSLVGPRPEVRQDVELFRRDYEEILQVRPGITDLASLKYRDEADILGQFHNPEEAYVNCILPDKISLAKEYIKQSSLLFDLQLICKTLGRLVKKDTVESAKVW